MKEILITGIFINKGFSLKKFLLEKCYEVCNIFYYCSSLTFSKVECLNNTFISLVKE